MELLIQTDIIYYRGGAAGASHEALENNPQFNNGINKGLNELRYTYTS